MDIAAFFSDKTLKANEKSKILGQSLLSGVLSMESWLEWAKKSKDPVKASCLEGLEWATQSQPQLVTEEAWAFVVESLGSKAPRVQWEAAKVIAHTGAQFPQKLDRAISLLLRNTEQEGTVVRWSAATALAALTKFDSDHQAALLGAFEGIVSREEKNSIRKIYVEALKRGKK